jgi:RimJ/RimL family protein N-acetyltransferase
MIDYGFSQLKLHKIMLRVIASNKRAIQSYKKAGFSEEGYLKDEVLLDGEYTDLVLMGIINQESDN